MDSVASNASKLIRSMSSYSTTMHLSVTGPSVDTQDHELRLVGHTQNFPSYLPKTKVDGF